MDICLKSLLISFGGLTLGTCATRARLYAVEYLHCTMLAQIMSCTTGASSSQYRLNPSRDFVGSVAFLGFIN